MSSYGLYTGDTYEGSSDELHDMEAEAAASYAAAMEAENVNAMTESDERTIYEWLPLNLKGVDYALLHDMDGVAYAAQGDDEDGGSWEDPLPRLDMNFAFDVCIPKLKQERAQVMYDNMGSNEWWIDPPDRARPVLAYTDFYSALLAYIKGAK